jgi:uncharacterized membrane protein SirB2
MAIDLTLLAMLVQTVVITLTLLVFIFQFRSQEKAIRESSYQNVLGRYNDYVMSSSGIDDLLLTRLFSPSRGLSKDEMAGIRRMMIAYGILEETYELYKKKWIDKETWDQWDAWLRAMCAHPHFAMIHAASQGMFDKDFQAHVSQLVNSHASRTKKEN